MRSPARPSIVLRPVPTPVRHGPENTLITVTICQHLRVADIAFTVEEACQVLDPPLSERQLRMIIRALGWQPDGHRYTGRSGHPASTYDAARLMRLHGALIPFMDASLTAGQEDRLP